MCLAVPVKILSLKDNKMSEVELDGVKRDVSVSLIEDPAVGDYVLLHAGFAIEKIDEEQAQETLKALRQISQG